MEHVSMILKIKVKHVFVMNSTKALTATKQSTFAN